MYLLIFILWQVINTGLLVVIALHAGDALAYLVSSLFSNIFINEGGVIFVLPGLVFYLARDSRFKLTVLYTLFYAGYAVVDIFDVASLPLLLLYNGQRGKNIKHFFYIFYPAHITVLFLISAYF